jgi:hypothetical protein
LRDPNGRSATLIIERKPRIIAADIPRMVLAVRRRAEGVPFVVSSFLSPRTRELLAEAGAGYADATGNLRLVLDTPAIFVERSGADRDPEPEARPLRSLKGPGAGRVVRALLDFLPPYGVRELAARAGVGPASASRVVEILSRDAIVTRGDRGKVVEVEWKALLRRWTVDYGVYTSNRVTRCLEPRGLPNLRNKLPKLAPRYAVTGSLAASQRVRETPTKLVALYVESAGEAVASLGLRTTESGANVVLLEPFDPVVFERTWKDDGVTFAALSQVCADLSTGGGREPAEGEALLRWMESNVDAWRA